MAVIFEVETYQTDVVRIVEDVFRTMLGVEASPCERGMSVDGNTLTAAVQFVGEWKGALILHCSADQAIEISGRLLPGVKSSKVDENVRDALGELANMIGGNLKSVLPAGVALSMPSVIDGEDYALHLCGGNDARTTTLSSQLGEFRVTLVRVTEKQ